MKTIARNYLIIKIIFLICIIPILNNEIIAQTTPKRDYFQKLDKKINAWLDEFMVPGAALALIENGEIIYQKGYGYADVINKIKINTETGFNIGSISKTVTAWGIMKLVEEGKIDLDHPAEKYLSRWHLPKSEFDVNKVTIRRLLSHTAGLSLFGYPGWSPNDTLPTIEESLSGKTNGAGDVRVIMEPGSRYRYSGGGYSILQLIIEEVSGKKFSEYMQTEILEPLGMKNSSFTFNENIKHTSSLEHDRYGDVIPFELFTAKAAAGLHSTIEDFALFAKASLYKSNPEKATPLVLKPETIRKMITPTQESGGQYGLGYGISSIQNSNAVFVGHTGVNDGWNAYFNVNPESGNGFVMFTNARAGLNICNLAFCKWISWSSGISSENNCKKDISQRLAKAFKNEGIKAAIAKYKEVKKNEAENYFFREYQLNRFGYYLVQEGKLEEAIAIFKLNAEEYPESWNVYDSLAEAYLAKGEKKLAIVNYQKSVELNPENTNGINILKKLRSK